MKSWPVVFAMRAMSPERPSRTSMPSATSPARMRSRAGLRSSTDGICLLLKVIARSGATVAVGTLIAERPPHRTVRAAFPHTAPPCGRQRLSHADPALSPEHVLLVRIPLGLGPSLHRLRSGVFRFVRWLPRYYGLVRLPAPVHHRRRHCRLPDADLGGILPSVRRGISQVPTRSFPT